MKGAKQTAKVFNLGWMGFGKREMYLKNLFTSLDCIGLYWV